MLNIKLNSSTEIFTFDCFQSAQVYGQDENYLRTYDDFTLRDLVGWYLTKVSPFHIVVSNEVYNADITVYTCVCLDCGHKTVQLYEYCEKCGSMREPTYLEI